MAMTMSKSQLDAAKENLQSELRQVERIIKYSLSGKMLTFHAKFRREIIVYLLEQPDDKLVSIVSICKQQYVQLKGTQLVEEYYEKIPTNSF